MKKILGVSLLAVGVLALTACQNQPADMSYDEAYSVFVKSFDNQNTELLNLFKKDFVFEDMAVNLQSLDDELEVNVAVESQGTTDTKTTNMDTNTEFFVSVLDLMKEGETNISGNLSMIKNNDTVYAKINDFDLNFGAGDAGGQLISLIISRYADMWIEMDYEDLFSSQKLNTDNVWNFVQNMDDFKSLLSGENLFVDMGKVEYEGLNAYRVSLNDVVLEKIIDSLESIGIVSGISKDQIQFDAMLVIDSADEVSLIVDVFVVDGEKPFSMGGKISAREIDLEIVDPLLQKTVELEVSDKRSYKVVNLKTVDYRNTPLELKLKLLPEVSEDKLLVNFDGSLSMTIPQFTLDQSLEKAVFDLKGTYSLQETGVVEINQPDEYIVLSQVLADKYGLSSMILGTGDDETYVDMSFLTGEVQTETGNTIQIDVVK